MATMNYGFGSNDGLSSLQHGSAYPQAYNSQNSGQPGDANEDVLPIVFVAITAVIVLLRLVCCCFQKEQDAGGEQDGVGQPPSPQRLPSGALAERDPSAVAIEEMASVRVAELPLVCMYRKADGWGDDSCGVCLAELADGEALRVLPACMHFFHAACINEWLRAHDTCPLCRAPLLAPADAT